MALTEFYCNASAGDNTNAGSTEGAPAYTATNGGWDSTTGVFTPASGDPSASVSVGMFASVFLDGATVAVFVGRVTAVNATAVTVSLTAKSGTAPATGASGRTLKAGGVWKGPNGASAFPFNFVQNTLTNADGDYPRVNLKNNAAYNVTAAMTHANNGPARFQGYAAAAGDGGRATVDGGTAGASYVLLTVSGTDCALADLVFGNNGATGTASGVSVTGARHFVRRCVVHDVRGVGLSLTGIGDVVECEAYACNQSNAANLGGFSCGTAVSFVRCVAHDNAGSNASGFVASGASGYSYRACVADTNGAHGWSLTTTGRLNLSDCDAYNNGGDGARLANATPGTFYAENCNFAKNGGYGVNGSTAVARNGALVNCGFGSGTQANTSGATNGLSAMDAIGPVTYAADVTPWADPAGGDFRVSLAAAKGAGRGAFTQTQGGYGGTAAYPDIGAAQHQDAGGGGGGVLVSSLGSQLIRAGW